MINITVEYSAVFYDLFRISVFPAVELYAHGVFKKA